jgi:MoaA/NifB/PqqE/SkfB family radical SAM enzyme
MLDILPKTLLLNSYREFGWPRMMPINFTILISTMCNSRCKTCNIWKQIRNDLTLDEWDKTLASVGKMPYWFTISGGEPFLQEHIADLAILVYKHCKPGVINIPTNSLMGEKIYHDVEKILKDISPSTNLVINLSMDGVGEKHDEVRGAPGNFPKILENLKRLKNLKKKYFNLTVGIHTVVSKFNVDHIEETVDFALGLEPDQFISEIAEERVELDTVGLDITPESDDYNRAIDYAISKIVSKRYQGLAAVTESFRLEYYKFVKNWRAGKEIKARDFAGWGSAQIASWGEVWPSCIGGIPLGNVREVDYDFGKIWFGQRAEQVRARLKKKRGNESFPLANAFYSNALCNYHILGRVVMNLPRLIKF